MPTELALTDHEHVTVLRSDAESLEVEARYLPGGKGPVAHLHPSQDERFEVLAGTVTAKVGGEQRTYGVGDVFEVRRGTPHSMWNAADTEARVRWTTSPALDTLGWFTALDGLRRAGRTSPLDIAPHLIEHDAEFRLAGPRPVMKVAVRALAVAGRLKAGR